MDTGGPVKERKKFLGIYFKCCNIYGRIYRNKASTAYEGMCPQCKARVRVPIGEGGTRRRLFVAE